MRKRSVIKAKKTTKWLGITVVSILLLAALGLSGCGSNEPAPIIDEGSVEVAAVEVQATETAVAEVVDVNVGEEEMTETAVTEESIDECLTCHIDKELLITTADPIEEVISENEGEG
jgi:hypothetical protein